MMNYLIIHKHQLTDDQNKIEEDRVHSIIYYFLLPIEVESCYYWEIRKIYLHKKNSGQATVYLGWIESLHVSSQRSRESE